MSFDYWFEFGILGSLAGALGMAATGGEFAIWLFMGLTGAVANFTDAEAGA